jgi:hypothetical protein
MSRLLIALAIAIGATLLLVGCVVTKQWPG